jgi:Zn-dependent protease with chaperone function
MKDFFDHQRDAIIRARYALAGFVVTLIVVIGFTSALVAFLLTEVGYWKDIPELMDSGRSARIAAIVSSVILSGFCLARAVTLRRGVAAQLRKLGGRRVTADSAIPALRQLYNIVEEMAIASGMPVPDVYVLDEDGINACAFGLNPQTTCIAVTQGAVQRLNREQQQAIVAHEFSHLLYGDFMLNTRLLVGLAGLFGVARVGYLLIFSTMGPRREGLRFGGIGFRTLPLFLLGWGFILVGSVGTFCGKLLQAAVSRQRKYLADASAVQFTRNPPAVAGALKTLGTRSYRGHVRRPGFIECAHMMFANAQVVQVTGLFSTHPPLADRIRRVEPDWEGTFPRLGRNAILFTEEPPAPPPKITTPQEPVLSPMSLSLAHLWLEETPDPLLHLLHTPHGAAAMVLHLLTLSDPAARAIQTTLIQDKAAPEIQTALQTLQSDFPAPEPDDRFPYLDLCTPSLRDLPEDEKTTLLDLIENMIKADKRISLFEYAVLRHLEALLNPSSHSTLLPTHSLEHFQHDVTALLSILARLDSETETVARDAFAASLQTLPASFQKQVLHAAETCTLAQLNRSCKKLIRLSPEAKRALLIACRTAIEANGIVKHDEATAFRAIASTLNVPGCFLPS